MTIGNNCIIGNGSQVSGCCVVDDYAILTSNVLMPVSYTHLYRQFGITMAIAIGFSALNALTLSPALCAIFLKPHDEGHGTKKMTRVERFHRCV